MVLHRTQVPKEKENGRSNWVSLYMVHTWLYRFLFSHVSLSRMLFSPL